MGVKDFFANVKSMFRAKGDIDWFLSSLERFATGGVFTPIKSVKEALAKDAWTRRALEVVTGTAAALPLILVDEENQKVTGNWLSDDFLGGTPNPNQTWSDFFIESIGWLYSEGHGGWLPTRNIIKPEQPVALYNLRGDSLYAVNSGEIVKPISKFIYNGNDVSTDDIFYFYWWTPDSGVQGQSPLQAAIDEIGANVAMAKVIRKLWENSSRPGGLLVPDKSLDENAWKLLNKTWTDTYGGAQNAGKTGILSEKLSFINDSLTPHETQMVEGKGLIRKTILAAVGIAEVILIAGESTYENLKQARLLLYELTIIPLLSRFESILTQKIAKTYNPGWKIKFDLSDVSALKPDWEHIANAVNILLQAGVVSKDEARRDMLPVQYAPMIEGGNIALGSALNVPIGTFPDVEQEQTGGGKKKKPPKSKALSSSEILRAALSATTEDKQEEPEQIQRKSAGGFSGEAREAIFQVRKTELEGYSRSFKKQLKDSYTAQRAEIKRLVDNSNEELSNLPEVSKMLNWKEEVKNFRKWSHPILLGVVKDAGSKQKEDFTISEIHMNKVGVFADKFSEEVNATTKRKLEAYIQNAKTGRSFKRTDDEEEIPSKKKTLLILLEGFFTWTLGARLIADTFTEVHNAQGYGMLEGMAQDGQERKQWLSAFMPASREGHMEADGQERNIDEPFEVRNDSTGAIEYLMYPGDMSQGAEVGNVVNCVCTMMTSKGE
jgi:HK97 family phage portal protein